ncbi:MAG: hypothetical protein CME06_16510 [Gemmatimonadetes bacterium]|nr:hypothetical protein [Gemmatimonadota bacterium]
MTLWLRRSVIRGRTALLALGALALILRLFDIAGESVWLDEASVVTEIQRSSFAEMRDASRITFPGSPPLYHYGMYGWGNLVGVSELALRLPSALFGTVAVLLAAWLLRSGGAPTAVAVLAPLAMALNATHIEYSQEARCYALFVALATWSSLAYLRLGERGRAKHSIPLLYIVATSSLLYTHIYAFFVLGAQWFVHAVDGESRRRFAWRRWLGLQIIIALLYVPWGRTMAAQVALEFEPEGGHTFLDPPNLGTIPHILKQLSGGDLWADGWIAFGLLCAGVALAAWTWIRDERESRRSGKPTSALRLQRYLFAWLIFIIGAPTLVSITITPILGDVRYVLPAIVPFVSLGIWGIIRLPGRAGTALSLAVLAATAASLPRYYGESQREPWREVGRLLELNAEPEEALLLDAPWISQPIVYYFKGPNRLIGLERTKRADRLDASWAAARAEVEPERPIWLVLAFDLGTGREYLERILCERRIDLQWHLQSIDLYRFAPVEASPPVAPLH